MKPRPAKYSEYDLRVTPTDQVNGILLWSALIDSEDAGERLLVCQEGGTIDCKLHYHAYFKSRMSRSHLVNKLQELAGGKGNPFYSIRQAHEGTIGYTVKGKNVAYRHNYDDTHITEFFSQSDQYRADVEAQKKRTTRKKQRTLAEICKSISDNNPGTLSIRETYDLIAMEYDKLRCPMPTRSALEVAIMNMCSPEIRRAYYLKHLESAW